MAGADRSEPPALWPAREPGPAGAESIGGELAARIAVPPAVPTEPIDWASTAAECDREARERGSGKAAAQLFHEVGRIHEVRLGDPSAARSYYEAAIAADPGYLPALQAARRLTVRAGQTESEVRLLEAEALTTPEQRRAAALDYARARLLDGALGRIDEASAALATAAARDPSNFAALAEHARLAAAAGRLDELLSDWVRAADASSDDLLGAQLLTGAAAVAEEALDRPAEAAELALRAFRRCPEDPAARALAWIHAESLGQGEELSAILDAEGRTAGSGRAAAMALLALALLETQEGRAEQALRALAEARHRAPDDGVVLAELARAAEAREAWGELAEVLEQQISCRRADADTDAAARQAAMALGLHLAQVLEERLQRPEEAATAYRAVLKLDPGNRGALTALGRHYARAGDWERVLTTFLAERDAATDPRDRAQRCFKAAELLEERLHRPDEAERLYAEALELDPSLLSAARARERLLEQQGRFADLADLLERELARIAEPTHRVALLFRLARLREDRLADLAGAAGCYERVLEIEPRHDLALRSVVVVLERSGPSAALAAALSRAATAAGDTREAVTLHSRAGEVFQDLGEEERAASEWEFSLALEPSHLPALRALGRLYARAGRWEDLVRMGRAEAQVHPSNDGAAALLVRIGEILATRLGRPDEAIAAWREAVTLVPGHPAALRALARLHRTRGDAPALAAVLQDDAAARPPAERALLLYEAAGIQERSLGDAAGAVHLHEEALRADPAFTPSHRALQRLLAAAGRWQELADACRRESEIEGGPARAGALLRLAWTAAERLLDGAAAEAVCREILAIEPGHAGASLLLDRLQSAAAAPTRAALAARLEGRPEASGLWLAVGFDERQSGAGDGEAWRRAAALDPAHPVAGPAVEEQLRAAGLYAELAALWEAREAAESDPWTRAECALRAGDAWEESGDLTRAGLAHQRSHDLAPEALPPLQALRRARARSGDWAGARDLLRAEAAASRNPSTAAAALARAAEISLRRLNDRQGAAEDLRQALARDPADAGLAGRLMDLLPDASGLVDVCEIRESRARAATDPMQAAEEWLAAARAAGERGLEPARALSNLDRALAARPAWPAALLLRSRLLTAGGRHADAVKDLTACLALGADPAAGAPVHLELAALYQGPLADPARAVSHLNAALAAAPGNAEALTRLSDIHRQAQNWPAAADALRRLAAADGIAPQDRADRLVELAAVRMEGFGDPRNAEELCEQALELVPGHGAALDLLARLKEESGDVSGLATTLERLGAESEDSGVRARARRRAAQLFAGPLGDPSRAASTLRAGLAEEPRDLQLREKLAEVLAADRAGEALEELRRVLQMDASHADGWRTLFRIFHQTKAFDRAFVAAGVLRFLHAADPASDAPFYADNLPGAPVHTGQVLTPADWATVRHPLDRGPLSELLALVGEPIGHLLPRQHASATKARPGHPIRRLLEETCHLFAVEEYSLYEDEEGAGLEVDAAAPDRVCVGPDFTRRYSIPEQRFLIGRIAARLRGRSALAGPLDSRALGQHLAAAVRQAMPGWSGTGIPDEALVKKVAKQISRRARRDLEDIAERLGSGKLDVLGWYGALYASADQAGLLVAGDIAAALAVVLRDGGPAPAKPETAEEIREAARTRPDLQSLLLFAASEEHFRLRQKLKLAIA